MTGEYSVQGSLRPQSGPQMLQSQHAAMELAVELCCFVLTLVPKQLQKTPEHLSDCFKLGIAI